MVSLQVKEGRLSFLLLMMMLFSIIWSMEMADWVEGLYVVEWSVLGGLILGFLLTRSRWPRIFRHMLGVLVGVPSILYAMTGFIGSNEGWRAGLTILAYHFDAWLRIAAAGESSTDTTMFVLLICVLGWWLGYASAWLVFGTHKVWQALALTGTAMLVVVYGSPSKVAPFFVLYLFCALLLAVRLYVYRQEQSWEKAKAHYDRDISFYFLRDGGLLLAIVLGAIWVLPLLSSSSVLSDLWTQVEGPWQAIGDQWNRLFSGIRGYRQDYENVPFAGYLALGGPIELGNDTIMWVNAEEGRYWRGAVYEQYDGTGWQNTGELSTIVAVDKDLPREEEYELRRLISQTMMPNWSGVGQIFGLGQPVDVDVPVEVQYSFAYADQAERQDPFSGPAIVSLIKSRIPLSRDRPYTVVSSVSTADVDSLRQAGDEYPAWVTQRYLQLPSTLPQRTRELAEDIAGDGNPYDRAAALRDYLRRAITYNKDVEPPPPDRDGVDYLLFDSREGYCNYYASAMVVMARAVGIPSRLAVGYMGGDFDQETGWYEVRERDTHAWAEVYFPRYGWVEFEPTASEAPIVRPAEGGAAVRDELAELRAHRRDLDTPFQRDLMLEEMGEPSPASASRGRWGSVSWAIGLVLVVASAGAAGSWIFRKRTLRGTSEVERSYLAMASYGRLLGVGGQACHTPHEYGTLMAGRVPERTVEIWRVVTLYVQDQFSSRGAGQAESEAVVKAWRRLRRSLWRKLPGRAWEIARLALSRPLRRFEPRRF